MQAFPFSTLVDRDISLGVVMDYNYRLENNFLSTLRVLFSK